MAIISGSGRSQPKNSLEQRLANPELRTSGKILNFFGDRPVIFDDIPPYSANVIQETIEQTPIKPVSVKQRIWQYRGGAAIVAAPGDVLPKVYGTTIVQGRVIWSSVTYLDDNSRPRIDVAYGLAQGVIDAMIKIYGGNDKKLLYSPDSIKGVINGARFWKKLNFHDGALDQEKDQIIVNHKVKNETPNYHGLSYVVFKGLKLWKFNKTSPDLWFVIGSQIDEFSPDEYPSEPIYYNDTVNRQVTSIAGISDDTVIYVTASNSNIYKVNLETGIWTSLGTAGSNTKKSNSLRIFKDELYVVNANGLNKYDGVGTSWTNIHSGGTGYLSVNPDDTFLAFEQLLPGLPTIMIYDGNTVTDLHYDKLGNYPNLSNIEVDENDDIWVSSFKSASDCVMNKYDGSWEQSSNNNYLNMTINNSIRYDSASGKITFAAFNTSFGDQPLLWRQSEFLESPGIGDVISEIVQSADTKAVSSVEFFSNRYHVSYQDASAGQNLKIYRRNSANNWELLPPTIESNPNFVSILQKIGTKLYAGTDRGFYQVAQ